MSISTGSLFSGVCSEHWALSCLVDTRPVFAADNDRYAARFIRQNVRPGILVEEDLARVPVQSLPYVDVFLAGAPCQSFSTIGRRIDEGAGRWRDLTATEAFRIQSFDPRGFDLSGLSRRQQMYLAGNAIDQCVLKALFKSLL